MCRLSKEYRSWNVCQIRSKDIQPEFLMRSMLHMDGLRCRLHESCQYACMPKSRQTLRKEKFAKTVIRDNLKEGQFIKLGCTDLTVWECELKRDPIKVIGEVKQYLVRHH